MSPDVQQAVADSHRVLRAGLINRAWRLVDTGHVFTVRAITATGRAEVLDGRIRRYVDADDLVRLRGCGALIPAPRERGRRSAAQITATAQR